MGYAHNLSDEQVVNGICLQFAGMIRDEVKQTPEFAEGCWKVKSDWGGQTESTSKVCDSRIGGDEVTRSFSMTMDQPHELCGGNRYASPQEHLLAALAGCFISNFSVICALRNIELNKLSVEMSGVTDMRGLFDIDCSDTPGFRLVDFTVSVAGNASPEELEEVFQRVCKISPNLDGMASATRIKTELDILPD